MQAALPQSWPCRSMGRCQHGMTHLLPSLAKGPWLRPSVWRCGSCSSTSCDVGWGMQSGRGNPLGDGGCWEWVIPYETHLVERDAAQ